MIAFDTSTTATTPRRRRSRLSIALLIIGALVIGFLARSLVTEGADSILVRWLPWLQEETATVYFGDPGGAALVPVARVLPRDATAEDLVAELLAGPAADSGATALLPPGTTSERIAITADAIEVDFSGDPAAFESPLVRESLRQTLAGWNGAATVQITVGGEPIDVMASSGHLVYFYDESRDMLLGFPTAADEPRAVLAEFLAGPGDLALVGLPADVELLEFDFTSDSGLLSLDFTYLPSVRNFALDHPDAMRRVLEGLIATMTTGFPQIDGLYLDFEGRATLGLGQCADLLRTLQLQPEVLNDERLLARAA
jgi:hypothetical protein